jgi:hypothetical protein
MTMTIKHEIEREIERELQRLGICSTEHTSGLDLVDTDPPLPEGWVRLADSESIDLYGPDALAALRSVAPQRTERETWEAAWEALVRRRRPRDEPG